MLKHDQTSWDSHYIEETPFCCRSFGGGPYRKPSLHTVHHQMVAGAMLTGGLARTDGQNRNDCVVAGAVSRMKVQGRR